MTKPLICALVLSLPVGSALAARTTVAVAPFVPLKNAPPWIGVAVADSLNLRVANQLALNALTLRQVNAAMRQLGLAANQLSDPEIAAYLGRQLGADLLVTGDYGKRGDRISLSIRVIDTATLDLRAWRKRTLLPEELIEAEADLARVVATVLGVEAPEPAVGAFGTTDLLAWENTTRALMVLRRQSLSPRAADPLNPAVLTADQLNQITQLLAAATTGDPTYGRAWAALGIAQALAGDFATGWQTLGRATANGAGEDSVTILGSAFVRLRQGRVDDAAAILRAAIARRPGFLHARGNLGHLFNHYGRFRESRAAFRAYAEAAPKQPWVLAQIGYANARLGKRQQAIADTKAALALLPESPYLQMELASRYIDARDLVAALSTLEEISSAAPEEARVHVRLGYVHLLRGDDRAAIESANRALALATEPRQKRDRAYAHLNLARAYGHLGDLDRAFEHLGQARAAGLSALAEVDFDPALEKLRADPRYAELSR